VAASNAALNVVRNVAPKAARDQPSLTLIFSPQTAAARHAGKLMFIVEGSLRRIS
jgi:hypothetical protein